MKKLFAFLMLLVSVLSLASCGDIHLKRIEIEGTGAIKSTEYINFAATSIQVSQIHVKNNGAIVPVYMNIYPGEEKKIVVKSRESILEHITVETVFDTIDIYGKSKTTFLTDYVAIDVYGYVLSSVKATLTEIGVHSGEVLDKNFTATLSDASKLYLSDYTGQFLRLSMSGESKLHSSRIEAKKVEMNVSGTSLAEIQSISSNELKITQSDSSIVTTSISNASVVTVDIEGNSQLTISGTSDSLDLIAGGSAVFLGRNLEVGMATVLMSARSKSYVNADKGITLIASGTAQLIYYGTATITQTNITGQAIIERGEE